MSFDVQLRDNGAGAFDIALSGDVHALAGLVAGQGALAAALARTSALAGTLAGAGTFDSAQLSVWRPLSFAHYVGVVEATAYLGELVGPAYLGGLTAADYLGGVIESIYRGVIDLEGDDMFAMVVGDRSPSFAATLKNAETGLAVDLTSAEAVDAQFKIGDDGEVTTAPGVIVTPAGGLVRYDWGAGDLDQAGTCFLRFVVSFPVSKSQTFPSDGTWYEFPVSE